MTISGPASPIIAKVGSVTIPPIAIFSAPTAYSVPVSAAISTEATPNGDASEAVAALAAAAAPAGPPKAAPAAVAPATYADATSAL